MAAAAGVNKLAISFLLTTNLELIDSGAEGCQSKEESRSSAEGCLSREESRSSAEGATSAVGSVTSAVSDAASNNSGRYHCSTCSMKFANGAKLLYHRRSHGVNGRNLHVCEHCEIGFVKECQLRSHIRCVHLKERPHKCKRCTKSFFSQKDLSKHVEAVHEGLRPFPCTTCGARFGMSQHLKRHVRTVHKCQ